MSNTSDFKVKNGLSVGTSITAVGSLTTAGQTFPAADGSTGQYLKTDGSGALSWGTVSTSFNITDGTTTDTVGLTETVTFTGGTNITLAVTDNTVTINNDHVNSSDITENTNLFFTDARAIAAVQAAADLTIDGGTIYVDTSANRVGISDTSPQQTLDVAGNIGVNGTEVINASSQIVGAVLDSALTVGGSLAGVLSNLKVQYGTAYSGTPIQGSFFFDSLNQKLKVYTGSAFIDAVPAGSGGGGGGGATDANTTFRNYSYTLTGTTSAVSGADDNEITAGAFIVGHKYTITATGNTNFVTIGAANSNVNTVFTATGVGTGTGTAKQTLFYDTTSSATRVVAYVNGIKQVYGSGRDFVATTGTSVAFTYNLGSGDTVDLQVYELLTNAAYYLKTETLATTAVNSNIATAVADYLPLAGGTMTGALNIESGDNLQIKDRGSVLLYNTNDDNYGRIRNTTASGNELQFSTNALAMTIDINGKVGIGTAAPASRLDVLNGTANTQVASFSGADAGGGLKILTASTTRNDDTVILKASDAFGEIAFTSDNTEVMRITKDNNVGIGTTAPTSKLHIGAVSDTAENAIAFSNNAVSGYVGIEGSSGNRFVGSAVNNMFIGTTGADGLELATNNNVRMVINPGGNVGIGTAAPTTPLHVNGTAIIGSASNQSTSAIAGLHVLDNNYSHWSTTLSKQQVALRVETFWNAASGGRTNGAYGGGIGFNHLGGHSGTHDENVHAWVGLRVEDTPGHERSNLVFATNNITTDEDAGILERMCITPAGDVGINTKEPKEKLHVDGPSAYGGPKWGTWTETMTTINGGSQTVRIVEDWSGRWVLAGRWAANAAVSVTGIWSSVRGLSTSTSQSEATAFSADFGESYPTECRFLGATDFTNYYNTRTIDFIHGVPVGRPWELFMSGGVTSGMTSVQGVGSAKYGWTARGAYDGFGRWSNPNYQYHRISDEGNGGMIHSSNAFRSPTNNAFNWNIQSDAKVSVDGTGATYSGQDTDVTSMFGSDDAYDAKFGDSWPSRTSNSNFSGTQLSSAVWVLIKMGGI